METKTRCYFLDLAKVITAFLVIYGHLFSEESIVRLYIYAFHMPLFFIISGIFHKYIGKINWGHYCKTILWPTLVFIILFTFTETVFMGKSLSSQLTIYFIDWPRGAMKSILWFLLALFWCKVLMDFFLTRRSYILPIIIWGILLFIPVLLKFRLPFALSNGMMALPFYALGYASKDWTKSRKESFRWALPFVVCLALTVLITRFHGRVSMVGVGFGDLSSRVSMSNNMIGFALLESLDIVLFYLNGVIGSLMILSLSLLPFPKTDAVTSLAKSLITVLGTQYIFINPIIRHMGYDNGLLTSFFLAILVYCLCYLAHMILKPVLTLEFKKKAQ